MITDLFEFKVGWDHCFPPVPAAPTPIPLLSANDWDRGSEVANGSGEDQKVRINSNKVKYLRNDCSLQREAACRLVVLHSAPRPVTAHVLKPLPRTGRGAALLHAPGAERRQAKTVNAFMGRGWPQVGSY